MIETLANWHYRYKRKYPSTEMIAFGIGDYHYFIFDDAKVASQMTGVPTFYAQGVKVAQLDFDAYLRIVNEVAGTTRMVLKIIDTPAFVEQFEEYITRWKSYSSKNS